MNYNLLFDAMIFKDDIKLVEQLLNKHGADVNAKNKFFRDTPLHEASKYGRANMVKLLLEYNEK